MKRSLFNLVLLTTLFATQCSKSTDTVQNIPPPVSNPNAPLPKTYLALGDSYTIGQSVAISERFPAQTVAGLRNMGISLAEPEYIAVTGWTTDNLSAAISANYPSRNYDVVSLLIGVNDQYQRHDTLGYRGRFLLLLNTATALARGNKSHVFVLSIPDYSVTPFAASLDTALIRNEINLFNSINRSLAIEQSYTYLDITPSTREALNDPTLIANDGLHPSGKEYAKWAMWLTQLMFPVLR